MSKKTDVLWCADFETTGKANYDKDGHVRVWLWSLVSNEGEFHGTTIKSFLDLIEGLHVRRLFFHNLRFDGFFLMYGLEDNGFRFDDGLKTKSLNTYDTTISDMGIWYQMRINFDYGVCKVWDSLKKFPDQGVEDVARLFSIPGKCDKPDFTRYIPDDYEPTDDEIKYCLQDSRIICVAMNEDWNKGHHGMTLSTDAFREVKDMLGGEKGYRKWMPELSPKDDAFVRLSLKGGWVYVNPAYRNVTVNGVKVFDQNSMYPWVMHDCPLPFGKPIARDVPREGELYIVQFTCMFTLKERHWPMVQIKKSFGRYNETEYLQESRGPETLTMTSIDYKLFHDQYDVIAESGHKYMCFKSKVGMLASYVDKWMAVKAQATVDRKPSEEFPAGKPGAESTRFLAKRYLNSPWGKTGMDGHHKNKVPVYDIETAKISFGDTVSEGSYIYSPYAAFVCSWARDKIVRAAQAEYDNFLYADTDSLHLLGEDHSEIDVHETDLGKWKLEGVFPVARYLRAKTYIHADEDMNILEIKCAGMTKKIKDEVTWDGFNPGAKYEGKLVHHHVKGGCYLEERPFRIKDESVAKKASVRETHPQQYAEDLIEQMQLDGLPFHEDMRALLTDDCHSEVCNNNRWKFSDKSAMKEFRQKMIDELYTEY